MKTVAIGDVLTNPETAKKIEALALKLPHAELAKMIGKIGSIIYNSDDGGEDTERVDAINSVIPKSIVPKDIEYADEGDDTDNDEI